jgi:TonB-dependent receptor-like protein
MASVRWQAFFLALPLAFGGVAGARAESSTAPPSAPTPAPASGPAGAVPEATPRVAGLSLVAALDVFRARGLPIVYSSDLVTPGMIVAREPVAATLRGALGLLVGAFGLEARDGPGGTILIVAATERAGATGPDTAAQPAPQAPGAESAPQAIPPRYRESIEVREPAAPPGGDQAEQVRKVGAEALNGAASIGGDPTRALARLPGLTAGDKSAALSIRGGAWDESLVVLDGMEIVDPFHVGDFLKFSTIVDSAALGGAQVMTGAFPAEFGDRMGGVIDLSSAEPAETGSTVFGASLVNMGLLSQGAFDGGDARWLVSARSWHPDGILEMVDPGGEAIAPAYQDLLGKTEMRLPSGSTLSAHVLMSHDGVDYHAETGDAQVDARQSSRYAWVTLATPWSPRLYSRTIASCGWLDRARDGWADESMSGTTDISESRTTRIIGLKQDWIAEPGPRNSLKWGVALHRSSTSYEYSAHIVHGDPLAGGMPPADPGAPTTIDRALLLSPSGTEFGAYLADTLRVAAPLSLEVGVRWDRQTLTDEAETSPRVNLLYAIGPRTSLRAGWGLFYQPQGINELQVQDGVDHFFPAERAEHRQIGLDHQFASGLALTLSAYDREITSPRPRYENLFNPMQLFPESEPDRVEVAPDRAAARGVEVELRDDGHGPFRWRAGYVLASAQEQIDGGWVARSWDQPHTVTFDVGYRRGEAWEFGLSGIYHTGWPTTDVTAVWGTAPDGTAAIVPVVGPRNAERYPAYERLDATVTRRIALDHSNLTLYLQVTNLLGRDNVCCASGFTYTPEADGGIRVDRQDGYWLRQLPIAGLKWEF